MENRLIFFAVEQAENIQGEGAKTEGVDFGKLVEGEDALRKLQEQEKGSSSLEHGGRSAIAQADLLEGNKNVTEKGKEVLGKKKQDLNMALGEHSKNPTEATAKKVNEAIKALKKSVKFQQDQMAEKAAFNQEFSNLRNLPGAKELAKDKKFSIESNKIDGLPSLEDFKNLKKGDQEKYLAELKKVLFAENGGEKTDKNLAALQDKLKGDKDVPASWIDASKWPNGKIDWKWINENLGEAKHQVAKYQSFVEKNSFEFNKAGAILLGVDAFRNKSRHERNDYLEKMGKEAARLKIAGAEQLTNAKISEGAQTKEVKTQNTAAIEKAEAETKSQAEKLAPQLQKFKEAQKLGIKAAARERDLENSGKKENATMDKVINLRQRAQAGESVGLGAKMKNLLGFGKKAAADDYNKDSAEGAKDGVAKNGAVEKEADKKDEKPKESMAARARREVASETLSDPKNAEEFSKTLGLKNVSQEQAAQLAALLTLEKTDAENVKMQLSPEIKAILARQTADDYEQKKAA